MGMVREGCRYKMWTLYCLLQKLDSISRKRNDFRGLSFFGEIALLLIDEVHLLSDPRGAALEAIVSRLKMLARYPEMKEQPIFHIRFVAVSATIPNVEDIGALSMVLLEQQSVNRLLLS